MLLQDLISQTIPLKSKRGSTRYMVPESGEPSSLVVDVLTQRWYHNASGTCGGAYTWARDRLKIDPARYAGGDCGEISEPEVTIDQGLARQFHRKLNKRALVYLRARGLSDDTIERFELGYNRNSISIPYYECGILTGIKLRRLDTDRQGEKYVAVRNSIFHTFNAGSVLVEGEFKAMILCQDGIEACSAPAGMVQQSKAAWFDGVRIYVRDNDAPGYMAAARALSVIPGVVVISVPAEKSVDDLKLHEPEVYRRWLEQLKKRLQSLSG